MRRALVLALAALACLLAAPLARSDEGGGTRSIFASGAGVRALSLGGAFVAVADDASALLWNAGALGIVERMEVQLAHAGNGEVGTREEYAVFVLPSWRWGVFGLGIQHFAVGGIEERDDRNALLGDDVSDSETEITLGFGRALSPALSVGGTVKMQRQSLAGYSGSGLGADLGVLVKPGLLLGSAAPWSDRLALGIVVRNAIEPSLRLDQESVADPATARAGFSYRHPFLGGRMLTLGMDFERAAGTGARFHSGLEVKMHPQLTLRAGTSHGALAAGTSIQWRELAFEYAYESGDLEAVHRVGISRPIGPTSGARRDAALLAEERAMLARVDVAARARLDDQVAGLMDEARAAMAGGDYDHALDLLGTVTTIAPGHAGAIAAEAASLAGKAARLEQEGDFMGAALLYGRALAVAPGDTAAAAGERRCRAESDRRAARSEEIRRLVSAGLDALASDRLPAARDAFARILALDPGDREAAAMLKRTERAMEARAVSPPRPVRRLELAPATVHAAPDSTPARAPAKPKPATKEVDDLYRKGLAAMSQGRSDAALRYWELVQSLHPSYQRVAEYLVREYLTRGMEQFAAGRVEEAMGHWQKALDVDPLDERARGYMARAQTQLARTRELTGGPR